MSKYNYFPFANLTSQKIIQYILNGDSNGSNILFLCDSNREPASSNVWVIIFYLTDKKCVFENGLVIIEFQIFDTFEGGSFCPPWYLSLLVFILSRIHLLPKKFYCLSHFSLKGQEHLIHGSFPTWLRANAARIF